MALDNTYIIHIQYIFNTYTKHIYIDIFCVSIEYVFINY